MSEALEQGYAPEVERELLGTFDHTMTLDGEPTEMVVEVYEGSSGFRLVAKHCGCELFLTDWEIERLTEVAREVLYG